MATIIRDFHHGLINHKAIRGFYYQPTTGEWTEVRPETLYNFWKQKKVFRFTDDDNMYIHVSTMNGYMMHIAVLMLGNENRKDTKRVARELERIRKEEMQNIMRRHRRSMHGDCITHGGQY